MKIYIKIFYSLAIISFLVFPFASIKAETKVNAKSANERVTNWQELTTEEKKAEALEQLKLKGIIINPQGTSTVNRLENRENNIERIRARLASTTASTSIKREEKLNNRLQNQIEQMSQIRTRLLEKESKVISVLQKIADKITERINILEAKAFNLTEAKAKLGEAKSALTSLTSEIEKLATLVETEITEENKETLFSDIRAGQVKVKTMAKEVHALLVETIKEINKVLPGRGATTTTTN